MSVHILMSYAGYTGASGLRVPEAVRAHRGRLYEPAEVEGEQGAEIVPTFKQYVEHHLNSTHVGGRPSFYRAVSAEAPEFVEGPENEDTNLVRFSFTQPTVAENAAFDQIAAEAGKPWYDVYMLSQAMREWIALHVVQGEGEG